MGLREVCCLFIYLMNKFSFNKKKIKLSADLLLPDISGAKSLHFYCRENWILVINRHWAHRRELCFLSKVNPAWYWQLPAPTEAFSALSQAEVLGLAFSCVIYTSANMLCKCQGVVKSQTISMVNEYNWLVIWILFVS